MKDLPSAVHAERVRLSANGRKVYPPTTFEVRSGSMAAVLGASGTGKTSLLLTVAGRMRGWHGSMEVRGIDAGKRGSHVRAAVGLGLMPGVNDLAEALTCAQHVAEARIFVPRSKRSAYRDVLAEVALDGAADVQVKRLGAEQRVRLGIALAILRDIAVLVVDDLDRDLSREECARVLSLLRDLADDGLTVVFACVDQATAALADSVVGVGDTEAPAAIPAGVLAHAVA